ncbi:MAG TPA: nicotinate-nicotinamide nucleotide adenylyltransferase, partial [Nevskiaceae bacterium]
LAFDTWYRWKDILDLAHLVLVGRPTVHGSGSQALRQLFEGRKAASAGALHDRPAGLWHALEIPPLAISSTRIRERLAAGRSLRGLVPLPVLQDFTPEDIRLLIHDEEPRH